MRTLSIPYDVVMSIFTGDVLIDMEALPSDAAIFDVLFSWKDIPTNTPPVVRFVISSRLFKDDAQIVYTLKKAPNGQDTEA